MNLEEQLQTQLKRLGYEVKAPQRGQQVYEARNSSQGMFLIGFAPGPSVVASTLRLGPPLPPDKLAITELSLTARVRGVRVSLRPDPSGTHVMVDGCLALDPDDPTIDRRIGRLLDLLSEALERLGLEKSSPSSAAGSASADARLLAEAARVVRAEGGFATEESAGEDRIVLVREREDDEAADVVLLVKDRILFVHAMRETGASADDFAGAGVALQRSLHFGRVIIEAAGPDSIALEYTHLLADSVSPFDVLHAIGASNAQQAMFDQMAAGLR